MTASIANMYTCTDLDFEAPEDGYLSDSARSEILLDSDDETLPLLDTAGKDKAPVHSTLGLIYMLIASFLLSTMYFLVKLLPEHYPTIGMIFYRSVVQLMLAVMTLSFNGSSSGLLGPPNLWLPTFLRGLFGASAAGAFFYATQALPLADAITLQFLTPTFTTLFATCVLSEPLGKMDLVGIIVCFGGVLLIAQPTWLFGGDQDGDDPVAVGVGMLGAAFAAVAYTIVRGLADAVSSCQQLVWFASITIASCPFLLRATYGYWELAVPDARGAVVLFAIGVCGFTGVWCVTRSLQLECAARATLMSNTQIVWSYIFQLCVLGEPLRLLSVLGTSLIVIYMVVAGLLFLYEERRVYKVDFRDIRTPTPAIASHVFFPRRGSITLSPSSRCT
eukprot:gb/GEZN01008669.1/.p1 GENE.gb/GEZN01008669.1/~~gb/GEZN01008669.1/.p1  ORF type:complete len:390 (+),score=20.76 gb/GEZN01008669.1/:156-1325(+)